jgi:hypothetical protein
MALKSQTTCESADRLLEKADDTNGNTEDIGGEVCARGGATLRVSVEGEACAMAGETKANRITASLGLEGRYHMIIQLILSQYHTVLMPYIHAKEQRTSCLGYTRTGHRYCIVS